MKFKKIIFLFFVSVHFTYAHWEMNTSLGYTYNPDRLASEAELYYVFPLWAKKGKLWEPVKLQVGSRHLWSPVYQFIGAFIYFEPIAIFDISFNVGHANYSPKITFGYVRYEDTDMPYDLDSLSKRDGTHAKGYRMNLIPRLKAATGPVVYLNILTISYFNLFKEHFFYEYIAAGLVGSHGVTIRNDLSVLYDFKKVNLKFGTSYGINAIPQTDHLSQRLMLTLFYTPTVKKHPTIFPYLILRGGVYLDDPHYLYEGLIEMRAGLRFKLEKDKR